MTGPRLITPDGRPIGASPSIACPGRTGVDLTPHLTPEGLVLAITFDAPVSIPAGEAIGIPIGPEVAASLGTGLIARAGQWALLQERRAAQAGVKAQAEAAGENGAAPEPGSEPEAPPRRVHVMNGDEPWSRP